VSDKSTNLYSTDYELDIFKYYKSKFGSFSEMNEYLYMSFENRKLFKKIYSLDVKDIIFVQEIVDRLSNLNQLNCELFCEFKNNSTNFDKQNAINKTDIFIAKPAIDQSV
jgi:hypothetical protein